jgi:hypothetical protein
MLRLHVEVSLNSLTGAYAAHAHALQLQCICSMACSCTLCILVAPISFMTQLNWEQVYAPCCCAHAAVHCTLGRSVAQLSCCRSHQLDTQQPDHQLHQQLRLIVPHVLELERARLHACSTRTMDLDVQMFIPQGISHLRGMNEAHYTGSATGNQTAGLGRLVCKHLH